MTKRQFTEQEVQIARYQFLSRKVMIRLPRAFFGSLSKNLNPTYEGIETSVRASDEVRARCRG